MELAHFLGPIRALAGGLRLGPGLVPSGRAARPEFRAGRIGGLGLGGGGLGPLVAAGLGEADAGLVAAAVGDLSLAVAQAAGYMAPAGVPAAAYVRLVEERATEILDAGRPASYPLSLAAVTQLTLDRLEADDPAAAQAVRVCAFLAPEPVPASWFTDAAGQLPEPLGTVAADPLAWGQALGRISGRGLARIDAQGLLTHRLTQAIIRTRLPAGEAAATRARAAALLTASHPGDEKLPSTWPGWARLLPHLLVLDPDASSPALSDLTHDAAWYLIRRGLVLGGAQDSDVSGVWRRWGC